MNNNVGKLNIEIGANGKQALQEIENLCITIKKFGSLEINSFQIINKSIKSLCGVNANNIYEITTALTTLI